jgi:hypothetical protein
MAEITRLDHFLSTTQLLLDKAAAIGGRIYRRQGDNVLRALLADRQRDLRRKMRQARSRRDLHERLLTWLDGYSYDLYTDSISYSGRLRFRSEVP